jgi:hypothetical protein
LCQPISFFLGERGEVAIGHRVKISVAGRFCEIAQNVAQPLFCHIYVCNTILFMRKRVAQKLEILLQLQKNLPKVNSSPNGENLPNLVALVKMLQPVLKMVSHNLRVSLFLQTCLPKHDYT